MIPFIPPIFINLYNRQRSKPSRFAKANEVAIKDFTQSFDVLEFSLIDVDLPYDLKWGWWSRIFEYELAISKLRDLGVNAQSSIHNTCWGYHGSHTLFKNELESLSDGVTNSDLLFSTISNTTTYDLRETPPEIWRNAFDFVLNISTIEEIAFPHIKVIENLLTMVKPGGILIATFDIPGIQLGFVENLLNARIKQVTNPVTGANSPYQMNEFIGLTTGFFVLRKI
jgi:SAM-dependent methyltransferase